VAAASAPGSTSTFTPRAGSAAKVTSG
jgi:hypothetical protein